MSWQTAFQPNAFQNDAFQIAGDPDGGLKHGWIKKKIKKKKQLIQDELQNSDDLLTNGALKVINKYVQPQSQSEAEMQRNGELIYRSRPPIEAIDYDKLIANVEDVMVLLASLQASRRFAENKRRKEQEEEDLFAIFLLLEF